MTMNGKLIEYMQNGPVIEIVLNRAEKRDAQNIPMVREMRAAIEALGALVQRVDPFRNAVQHFGAAQRNFTAQRCPVTGRQ